MGIIVHRHVRHACHLITAGVDDGTCLEKADVVPGRYTALA
jgi:hypothetical protein